jgi:hypothetical protein
MVAAQVEQAGVSEVLFRQVDQALTKALLFVSDRYMLVHWMSSIMTLETFVEDLSRNDKLYAMELLWRDLTKDESGIKSPSWHDRVVQKRLTNPMPGPALDLNEALAEIQGWRNDSKASS